MANTRITRSVCGECGGVRTVYVDGRRVGAADWGRYGIADGSGCTCRPPAPIRTLRVSDAEWAEIRRRAEAAGVSVSEFLRTRALSDGSAKADE